MSVQHLSHRISDNYHLQPIMIVFSLASAQHVQLLIDFHQAQMLTILALGILQISPETRGTCEALDQTIESTMIVWVVRKLNA